MSIKNINIGINNQPEIYDGYDVLYHTLRKTVDGNKLVSGIYKGKVVSVKRNLDPNGLFPFEVMVWIPELHVSVPEPKVYPNTTMKEVQGLKFFKPISDEVEEPCVGMVVNVEISDPSNIIGFYVGISSHEIQIKGDRADNKLKKDLENSAKDSVEKSAPQKAQEQATKSLPQQQNNQAPNSTPASQKQQEEKSENLSKEDSLKLAKTRDTSLDSLTPAAKEKVLLLVEKLKEENLPFMIWETRRSQIRQNYLYTKSRTTKQVRAKGITEFDGAPNEPWATGTLNSNHKGGNAVDMVLDLKHPYWKDKTKPKGHWDITEPFMPLWKRYRELANGVGLYTFGTDWPHVSTKKG